MSRDQVFDAWLERELGDSLQSSSRHSSSQVPVGLNPALGAPSAEPTPECNLPAGKLHSRICDVTRQHSHACECLLGT